MNMSSALTGPRRLGRILSGRGGGDTAGEVNSVGGKSGLQRAGRWVTPSRGDPKESATENYRRAVRVSGDELSGKGEKVGQEPTGGRVTGRPGKPRPEQDQIGGRSRRLAEPSGIGRWRRRATGVPDRWSPSRKGHRTRLTVRPRPTYPTYCSPPDAGPLHL